MPENVYSVEDLSSLVNSSWVPPHENGDSPAFMVAAVEISTYLQRAMVQTHVSKHKVSMSLAAREIWSLEGGPKQPTAAAIALLGAATLVEGSAASQPALIATQVRERLESLTFVSRDWKSFWEAAKRIGEATGFLLDKEAKRATRLWEALSTFAVDQEELHLGPLSETDTGTLESIEERVSKTDVATLLRLQPEVTAKAPSEPSLVKQKVWLEDPWYGEEWENLPPSRPDDEAQRVRVWFGTNRAPKSATDPNSSFSNKFADKLIYGVCRVNVPKVPDATGGLHQFGLRWFRVGSNRSKSSVEAYRRFASRADFLKALGSENQANSNERTGLVYVHGYRTTFPQAVMSVAELSVALRHNGPTALFSWASAGNYLKYVPDRDMVKKSREHLLEFLQTLTRDAGLDHVDVVVHSMGNELFLRSIAKWVDVSPPASTPLRNIFLGAPDVATPDFLARATYYPRIGTKTTLYASNTDSALFVSKLVNRGPRAGLIPPPVLAKEIDTMETNAIDLSRMGHSYILQATAIRSDIFAIQNGHPDPNTRPNIDSVKVIPPSPGGPTEYWRFRSR